MVQLCHKCPDSFDQLISPIKVCQTALELLEVALTQLKSPPYRGGAACHEFSASINSEIKKHKGRHYYNLKSNFHILPRADYRNTQPLSGLSARIKILHRKISVENT